MKKIILILLAITLMFSFTGCGKKEEVSLMDESAYTTYVDIAKISENRDYFASRVPSSDSKAFFQERVLTILEEKVNTGEISNFEVEFSDEIFSTWEECNDYAQNVIVGKTYLGSGDHYYLWNAQRLLNGEITWTELFKACKITTVAFSDRNWIGSCESFWKCFPSRYKGANIWNVRDTSHAALHHSKWQAFVVTPGE